MASVAITAAMVLQALGGVAITYERRDRGDTTPNVLRTDIETLTTQLRAEIARRITSQVTVAGGFALTGYAPRGTIPRPQNVPGAVRDLIATEMAFHATRNAARSGSLSALWQVTRATALHVAAYHETVAPLEGAVRHEFAPAGERTHRGVSLSAVIR